MRYREYGRSSQLIAEIIRHDPRGVAMLLAAGSDPNAPDEEGWRPLHVAVGQVDFNGAAELVTLLLRHGASINEWDVNRTETAILIACDPSNLEMARVLLEAGADPNVRRSDGESCLRLCASEQNLEMAKLLLRYGAGKTINEYGGIHGLTALGLAATNFDVPMIELLLREGADPATLQEFGETARDCLPPREEHDPQEWDRILEMLSHAGPGGHPG